MPHEPAGCRLQSTSTPGGSVYIESGMPKEGIPANENDWSNDLTASERSPSSSISTSRAAARPPTIPIVSKVNSSVHSNDSTPSTSRHSRASSFISWFLSKNNGRVGSAHQCRLHEYCGGLSPP